jgi:hypothetical protein
MGKLGIRSGRYMLAVLVFAGAMAWAGGGSAALAEDQVPFHASFHGTFTIDFGACANGDDLLHFQGTGIATQAGLSSIDGTSCLHPIDPLCSTITDTSVTVTAANGDTFRFNNQAVDCLDFSTPGKIFIHGSGTYQIEPGTGRFGAASGAGTVHVTTEVLNLSPARASGTFDPLAFDGTISTVASQ